MVLSDHAIAHLIKLSYGFHGDVPPVWAASNDGSDAAGVRWHIQVRDETVIVLFPGTENPRDLFRDVEAIPVKTAIGWVHTGFNVGIESTLDAILAFARARPIIVAGHSLGAARATLFTAYAVHHGVRPLRRVVFGEPLSGFAPAAELAGQISASSYCARDKILSDPIPSLPPAIGYTRATPLRALMVRCSREAEEDLGPLWIHSMIGYAAALDPTTN